MSPLARALAVGGGAVFVGAAGWVAVAQQEVSAKKREKDGAEAELLSEQNTFKRAESTALESESLIKALQQQTALERASMGELESELEAARRRVSTLEAQAKQKSGDIARMQRDSASAADRLDKARADQVRLRRSVALAQVALAERQAEVEAARLRMNPLNHPKVKSLLNR